MAKSGCLAIAYNDDNGMGKQQLTLFFAFLYRAEEKKGKQAAEKQKEKHFLSPSLSTKKKTKKLHLSLFSLSLSLFLSPPFFLNYSSPKPSEFMMASLSLSAILSFVA